MFVQISSCDKINNNNIFVHDEPILKLIDCKFYVTISVVCGNFT